MTIEPPTRDVSTAALILSDLVRDVARAHPEIPAPAHIATLVMDAIPVGTEREHLASLLPRYVAEVLRRTDTAPADTPSDDLWEAMLRERVPTSNGYRFLGDCTADDIHAGAERRRRTAENYSRRADMYDQLAAQVTSQHVTVAGDLKPETVVEVLTTARGYLPPGGATRLADTPRELKPTISELAGELAAIPASTLKAQLVEDDELLEKAALADVRGLGDESLAEVLRSVEVAERWYQALGRIQVRLQSQAKYRRVENGGRPTRESRFLHADAEQVTAQLRIAHDLVRDRLKIPDRTLPKDDFRTAWARRKLRDLHADEFHNMLFARFVEAGLPAVRPYQTPAPESAWQEGVRRGVFTVHPDETRFLNMSDAEFDVVVRNDLNSGAQGRAARGAQPAPELRLFGVLDRWRASLAALELEVNAQPPASDDLTNARRAVFRQTLLARRGEAGRLLKARQARIVLADRTANREDERERIVAEVTGELVATHRRVFEGLLQVAPARPPRRDVRSNASAPTIGR